MTDLDAIRARLAAATPGPWFWDSYSTIGKTVEAGSKFDEGRICDASYPECQHEPDVDCRTVAGRCGHELERHGLQRIAWLGNVPGTHGDQLHDSELMANAVLIAHAPADLAACLEEIGRLRAEARTHAHQAAALAEELTREMARADALRARVAELERLCCYPPSRGAAGKTPIRPESELSRDETG